MVYRPSKIGAPDAPRGHLIAYEHALVVCAEVLLTSSGTDALEQAALALIEAADADYLFIDRNDFDPNLGFVARNVLTLDAEGTSRTVPGWDVAPWSGAPDARGALAAGLPYRYRLSELPEQDRLQYGDGLTSSGVKIPIHIAGEWVGHIGFSAVGEVEWTDAEMRLLGVAANMISAFWERDDRERRLEQALEQSSRWLRYERAVSAGAARLLGAHDASATYDTVEEIRRATGATFGFLDRVEDDPDLGPVLVKECTVAEPGVLIEETERAYWSRIPLTAIPAAHERLRRGLPYWHVMDDVAASDRELYDNAPRRITTDLKLPIMTGGRLVGVLGFAHEESVRMWNDDSLGLLETTAQLIGSFWERQASEQRLQRLVESKDEFVASVSHELRTPLTAVVGLACELRDGSFDPDEVRDFIEVIADQSTEVSHIVEDLLVAARADIGMVTVLAEPVDLAAQIDGVLPVLDRSSVTVRGERPLMVRADGVRVRQIVRNLLTNCARYGGPVVEVRFARQDDTVLLEVRDNGPGVGEEHQAFIFDPYYRAHANPGQPSSVGLGLAVSHHLAGLMQGRLAYRRDADWSVFELTLPAL